MAAGGRIGLKGGKSRGHRILSRRRGNIPASEPREDNLEGGL